MPRFAYRLLAPVAVLVAALAGTALTASGADAATSTPLPLAFGVATPSGFSSAAELDQVTAVAGAAPTVVMSYSDFTTPLDLAGLKAVAARGATPVLTWEPWQWGGGVDQPAYRLAGITAGRYDSYLRSWASGLRSFGKPVYVRFAHEMNGTWYPWSEQANGNAAGDYVKAWRHVHDVVAAAGATNVRWVWSPNVDYPGATPLATLYPGASYVDVVAADGYNWGTSQAWSSWTSAAALFGGTFTQLRTLAPGKPIMVGETASAEQGGSKASWVTDLFAWLRTQPDVRILVWFDQNKETDWRIDSSASAATAFRAGLSSWRS